MTKTSLWDETVEETSKEVISQENNSSIKQRSVSTFFEDDKPAWASYDSLRKLPCTIDSFKISQRKLIWTAFSKCKNDYLKTETFANITSLDTAYIHGSANLCGVCASLTQDFIGACNYPYLIGNDSGWGNRLLSKESAPRYTKVKLAPITECLFNSIDNEILERQYFEGQYIEPKTLIPIFPTIFLNPSSGLTAGFSSTIYSRDPFEIIKYIKKKLDGVKNPKVNLDPWFRGYKGEIRYNSEKGMYEALGKVTKNNMTSYTITEVPVEISLQKYNEILDKLIEKDVIVDYEDLFNPRTNEVCYEIKTTREFTKNYPDEESVLNALKLVCSLPEQFNCIDENYKVREFTSVQEILDSFIDIRLKFYDLRKAHILKTTKEKLDKLNSKYEFCKGIIDDKIKVAKVKKEDIILQLEKFPKIIKLEGSYSYLLNMPIHSISYETLEELKSEIKETKDYYNEIDGKTREVIWLEDLSKLEKILKAA